MKIRWFVLCLAVAVLLLCGCDVRSPLAPAPANPVRARQDAPVAPVAPAARNPVHAPRFAQGPLHLEGELGSGALYAIDVPEDWNGDLVLWAHGYALAQAPVALPVSDNLPAIRAGVLERKFAFAVTSYSENGYAEAEGARQVHQLRGVFSDRVASPRHTMLLGFSLGGLIGLQLAEAHPGLYDAALLVSGVVGGTRAEVEYVGDVRVLFDALFPCPLPGDVTHVPDEPFPLPAVYGCVVANPQSIGALACTYRDPRFPLPGRSGDELVQTILRVLGFHWYAAEDLFDRTHEHQLYDNHDLAYSSCAPGLNDRIARYVSTPDAGNFMRQHYEPSGVLRVPVLTLHARHDPEVPAGHEALLREKAEAAGYGDNLVQRLPDRYGHTEVFPPEEVLKAFDDLMNWLASGRKPPA